MNTILKTGLLAALLTTMTVATLPASEVGKPAPDFTLKTNDDKTLTLSKLKGKRGAVLVFFATWCPACMAEVPAVNKFVEETREKDVLVYGVNFKQSQKIIDKFIADKKVKYRILLDSEGSAAKDYKVSGIPLIIGIDKAGIIQYRGHAIPENTGKFLSRLIK